MFETGNKRFFSMEFIEGTDLKRLLSERSSLQEQLVYYFLRSAMRSPTLITSTSFTATSSPRT